MLEQPRRRKLNPNGASAGRLPDRVPRQRPPWFNSDEQYEAFLKTVAHDIGPQCITATSIDVKHLDEQERRALLANYALRPTLEFVCMVFARLDAATLLSRDSQFEKQVIRELTADFAAKIAGPVRKGDRLMPPTAMTQLIREVIEWCRDADDVAPTGGPMGARLETKDFVHMLLSINGDQERQDIPDFFQSWPPTPEELADYNAAMSVDDEMVLREARRQMLSDLARMQAQSSLIPDMVLGDTYDTWFKGWSARAPHELIGDTPEHAFHAATGVSLRGFLQLGLLLWGRTKDGDVAFTGMSIQDSVDQASLELLRNTASLTVEEYRARLKRERKAGSLAHRRYTFTERPLLRMGGDGYITLRPVCLLDRLCGSQLYWQTFFGFGTEKDRRGEQFSLAMNYVFEDAVGYLLRRVVRRARPAITLITEAQMQGAWTTAGNTPSVCDWVLVSGRYCLVIDATNHWLDAAAAQGTADLADYQTDTDETFVNKKFLQLKSTIKLLAERGWEGCTFDEQTTFVPLVIVPNAGIPATALSDFDFKLRSHSVLGRLGKVVTAPGILIYRELQIFEGVCEHRAATAFVEMLAQWRAMCTGSMPLRPQTFLDLAGIDRPMGKYPSLAKALLMKEVGSSTN